MNIPVPVRKIVNKLYNALRERLFPIEFPACVTVQDPLTTLQAVARIIRNGEAGMYLRFGDGEVNALEGLGAIEQHGDIALASEMKETFALKGATVLKSLMIHSKKFGMMPGMKPGLHETPDDWAAALLRRCFQFFVGSPIHSHAALAYSAMTDRAYTVSFLRDLRATDPVFVGNQDVPGETVTRLFGGAGHIKTPVRDAYSCLDRIETEVKALLAKRNAAYDVIVFAMGPAGKILAKRLYLSRTRPMFLFDMGSVLDAFCGNYSREWITLAGLPHTYWSEMLDAIAQEG